MSISKHVQSFKWETIEQYYAQQNVFSVCVCAPCSLYHLEEKILKSSCVPIYLYSITLSGVGLRRQRSEETHPDFPIQLLWRSQGIVSPAVRHKTSSAFPLASTCPATGMCAEHLPRRYPGGSGTGVRATSAVPLEQQLYFYSSWVSVLLTLFVRERPGTLQRKLIMTACIRNLILPVLTRSQDQR